MNHITPVILCGGSGTRLWPLSRTGFPKQFLVLSGKNSFFHDAINRIQNVQNKSIILNDLLIITNEEHRFLVLDQLQDIEDIKAQIILEPVGRNTAPALTLAAFEAINRGSDPILIVMPSDQTIQNQTNFTRCLRAATKTAAKNAIVILGIKPNKPDTGFGYIQKAKVKDQNKAYKVLNFIEKPNLVTAKKFIKSGDYFWNSGIFVLRASIWLKAIKALSPNIHNLTLKAFNRKIQDNLFVRPNKEFFKKIPSDSIDFAVIEKCISAGFDLKMLELDAGWNDLGSWEAVWQSGKKDHNQNVTYGDTLLENTKNSLIFANHKLVSVIGLTNLVVIETSDALLIADKSQSQHVKTLVDKLRYSKREERTLHRKVSRPWGWYDNLDEGENFKVKRIQVNPGASLSLQKHSKRAEHWIVVRGIAEIICEEKKIILEKNQSTYIPLGYKHRLSNPGSEILEIIEVQSGVYLGEDDIERIDDKYGR
jgi:mannose-1-phosphate guanylyltransferase/mannose-6-phosphate isomerase